MVFSNGHVIASFEVSIAETWCYDANFVITGGNIWQPLMPPVMTKLASWKLVVFNNGHLIASSEVSITENWELSCRWDVVSPLWVRRIIYVLFSSLLCYILCIILDIRNHLNTTIKQQYIQANLLHIILLENCICPYQMRNSFPRS